MGDFHVVDLLSYLTMDRVYYAGRLNTGALLVIDSSWLGSCEFTKMADNNVVRVNKIFLSRFESFGIHVSNANNYFVVCCSFEALHSS